MSEQCAIEENCESEMERQIEQLDLAIFKIRTQTSLDDRMSLLRVHRLMRNWKPGYSYLEIGSFGGGTLLPHLVDRCCGRVISIDKRPLGQPDERGKIFFNEGNTTEAMRRTLQAYVPADEFAKLTTFDADASEVAPAAIGVRLDYVFIDGEHTNIAVFQDFFSMLPLLAEDAVIGLHDFNLVSDAGKNIQTYLSYARVDHRLFILPSSVALIALRGSIGPASLAFAAHALDEKKYLHWAKQRLWGLIARSVQERQAVS